MDIDIEELLKQDAERIRSKKKRLKAFASALDDSRTAAKKAAEAALELIEAGDLTRSEITKYFALTPAEKTEIVPAAPRRSRGTATGAINTDNSEGLNYNH